MGAGLFAVVNSRLPAALSPTGDILFPNKAGTATRCSASRHLDWDKFTIKIKKSPNLTNILLMSYNFFEAIFIKKAGKARDGVSCLIVQ